MQKYLSVPLNLLYRSSRLFLDQLALVETLGIGAYAVKRGGLKAGDEALVVGARSIGIEIVQFVSALGASVYVVEKNE